MIFDTAMNTFIQSIEHPTTVVLAKTISSIFDPFVLIVLSLIISFYIYIKSSKIKGVFFGGMMIFTGVLIVVAKEIFKRLRPFEAILPELSYSFPSGHSTMAVVFFGLLIYLFVSKKYRIHTIIISIALIFIIGLSRIYLRVHWLTDVLGGFLLGGIILIIGILILRKIS